MIKQKKTILKLIPLIFLALAILIIPSVNAVKLDLGLNMTASANNATISIDTIPIYVDQATITNSSIELINSSWTNGNLIVNTTGLINWTSGVIYSSQFPSLSTDGATNKVFGSSLPNQLATYTFNVDNCASIGNIVQKDSSGNVKASFQQGQYTCSNGQVALSLSVANGDTIDLDYSCSTFTNTGFRLIILLSALAIVAFVAFIVWRRGFELNWGDIMILAVTIIVAVILWQVAGQNLGAACPVS